MFEHLLLRPDPLAGIILKGHLLIERLLTEFLGSRVFRNVPGVERADLKFGQLLDLCRAWAPQDELTPLWNLIGKINTLRNDLGHALETPKRAPLLADIRHSYAIMAKRAPSATVAPSASDEDLLLATSALLSGVLLAMTHPNEAAPDISLLARDLRAP